MGVCYRLRRSSLCYHGHYSDVIIGAIASQSPASRLFTQPFIQAQIKENIKAPRHWPWCGEITGDRWIPRTNGQLRGTCFHSMRFSWITSFSSKKILLKMSYWKCRPLSLRLNVLNRSNCCDYQWSHSCSKINMWLFKAVESKAYICHSFIFFLSHTMLWILYR